MSLPYLFVDPRRGHTRRLFNLLPVCIAVLALGACQQKPEEAKPPTQVASSVNNAVIIADTPATLPPEPKAVQQLDVPVYVEGGALLLHPLVTLYTDDKGLMAQRGTDASRMTSSFVTPINSFDYTSNIDNLILENVRTGSKHRVFDHNRFRITRIFFPYQYSEHSSLKGSTTPATDTVKNNGNAENISQTKASEETKNGAVLLSRILYEVDEAAPSKNPTAAVNQRNERSRMALYMSDNSGNGLTRLHPANQFLLNSTWVEPLQRFYFVTRADSDNNGKLDDKDKVYYYYVDFTKTMPVIHRYQFTFN